MTGPRQAGVGEGSIGSRKLGIAVGRQIDAGISRAIQGDRERKSDGSDGVISVVADIGCAGDDTAAYLSYSVWAATW